MKRIKQFRYFTNGSSNNSPQVVYSAAGKSHPVTESDWAEGNIFDEYFPIVQLGIQALPGTRFYLNNSLTEPIIIGYTGIYDLELDGNTQITALRFSTESMNTIKNNNNAGVIVDIVYNQEEVE